MLNLFSSIQNELNCLEKKLLEYVETKNEPINQILETIFSSGGKRIRPALFLLVCKLLNYNGSHKFPIASVCEFIHTASLLHDDVIDNSTLRRNKPTVNSVWGDETAVLSGDLIYSTACRLMVKTKHLELIDCFAECIRSMSESELFQLEMLWNKNMTIDDYYTIVKGKTANLFEASCLTPAYLNNNSQEVCEQLSQFGLNLGFAFQIADDCLDFEGCLETVGKPVAADFDEGKLTLPLLLAMKSNDFELFHIVSGALESNELTLQDKNKFVNKVIELKGTDLAFKTAEKFANNAIQNLDQLKKLLDPVNESMEHVLSALKEITIFILNRKN
jgi:octaprenyl-diphosphate synthase